MCGAGKLVLTAMHALGPAASVSHNCLKAPSRQYVTARTCSSPRASAGFMRLLMSRPPPPPPPPPPPRPTEPAPTSVCTSSILRGGAQEMPGQTESQRVRHAGGGWMRRVRP